MHTQILRICRFKSVHVYKVTFSKLKLHTHTLLFPSRSNIHQSWVRDGLERPSVLIISSDSWSAGAVKNERVISRPPVLLIRKRTVLHHRMNWLPNAWGGKLLVAVCVVLFLYISTFEFNSAPTFLKYFIHNKTAIRTHFYGKQRYSSGRTSHRQYLHVHNRVIFDEDKFENSIAIWSTTVLINVLSPT